MTAIEYIQSLEKKVEELEGLLSSDGSHALKDDSTPPSSPDPHKKKMAQSLRSPSPKSSKMSEGLGSKTNQSTKSSVNGSDEDVIETMVGADESSFEGHRGSFAGLSLLQRMHNLCRHVSASKKQSDAEVLQDDFISAFDFASSESDSTIPPDAYALLPPKAGFERAMDTVLSQPCCNMQFLDRAGLEEIAADVYGEPNASGRPPSRKSFALLYAVLALSRRFEPASPGDVNTAQTIRG